MKLEHSWVVLVMNENGASHKDDRGENVFYPLVAGAYGPFSREEATEMEKQLDEEFDGSDFVAIIHPMIKLVS